MPVTIAPGGARDLEEILALLASAGLQGEGVPGQITGFLVARSGGRVVAAAGLENHGAAGILRSVAVAHGYRGCGIASVRRVRVRAVRGDGAGAQPIRGGRDERARNP